MRGEDKGVRDGRESRWWLNAHYDLLPPSYRSVLR